MNENYPLNPTIWGPHYWFFLHTIAITYPKYPNSITKKKYYELIQNFPLFIPTEEISNKFEKMLNEYPISPYLDNRETLVRWTHFIHNKINEMMEKQQITFQDFLIDYYNKYKSTNEKLFESYKLREKLMYIIIVLLVVSIIYYLYDK